MTETSIGISYYNCSGTYITDSVGSGQTVTFCANLFYGPIEGGSYTLLGACTGPTTTSTTTLAASIWCDCGAGCSEYAGFVCPPGCTECAPP